MSRVLALCMVLAGCGDPAAPIADGRYFGYQPIANLSPDEDPRAFWFYRNVLTVTGDRVKLDQSPRIVSRGALSASSSEGGFPRYTGAIERAGRRTILRLRKVACDYCGVPVDDPLPSRIEREYVVRFLPDGAFEVDRVIYRSQPDPRYEMSPTGACRIPDCRFDHSPRQLAAHAQDLP